MNGLATLLIASIGLTCIYAGYKLFCGLPALTRTSGASRISVFLLNILPGALLALAGTGLLAADARSILSHKMTVHGHEARHEGAAFRGAHHRSLFRAA